MKKYIRFPKHLVAISIIVAFPIVSYAIEPKISLKAEPSNCIVMSKGNVCTRTITLKWATPSTGKYCLYVSNSAKFLQCWEGNSKNNYEARVDSSESLVYAIMKGDDVIAQTRVEIRWVYRSKRNSISSWRLF